MSILNETCIGLVTYGGLPELSDDERAVVKALERHGLPVQAVVWDNPDVRWEQFACCVIRSTWDYHLRRAEFLAWAKKAGEATRLWNPPSVIEWNSLKTYLQDLEQQGVPVIPTAWVETGAQAGVAEIVEERGWGSIVIKPAVSLYGYDTKRYGRDDMAGAQKHLDAGLRRSIMMVQPYMSSVETSRERSLIFINGRFSHAVRRASIIVEGAREEAQVIEPSGDEMALAKKAIQASGFDTLYARVDMTRDDDGNIQLMELEMVEPYLFLTLAGAIERFAGAIEKRATG